MNQLTLVLFKPDAGAKIQKEFFAEIKKAGLSVACIGEKFTFTPALLEEHYGHVKKYDGGAQIFAGIENFLLKPDAFCTPLAISGEDAIATVRKIIGPTRMATWGLRKTSESATKDSPKNYVHASGNPAEAKQELARFFPNRQFVVEKDLEKMLNPKSIAIIGASAKQGSVGYEVLKNLVVNNFNGGLYPVNLNETELQGLKCYKNITEIPDPVDLAVIIVPAKIVATVMEECGAKQVSAAIIISAGFKEVGSEGAALEKQVIATANKHGIAVLGPNCLGALNTNKDINMNATFAPAAPVPGEIGFASQSGALVAGILNILPTLNVGVSQMVSLGNQSDTTAAKLMEFWAKSDDVKQALFYLEGVVNPREFKRQAEILVQKKPIIVVKSGRSSEGSKAAASHTGSLAGGDRAVSALFDSCGIIRETSLKDMFNTALTLGKCPVPKGGRVCIVTNSGGPGVLATDMIVAEGLEIAKLSKKTQDALRASLMPQAAVGNPVDVIASASPEQYRSALDLCLQDPAVDMLLVIYLYVAGRNDIAILQQLNEFKQKYPTKPIVGVFMTAQDFAEKIAAEVPHNDIPYFAHVEEAVAGMKRLHERSTYLGACKAKTPAFTCDKTAAAQIINAATERFKTPEGAGANNTLTTYESLEVFRAYGMPLPKYALIKTEDDLNQHENRVGYPCVLKISSYTESHKSDIGGVVLNIQNREQLTSEYRALAAHKGLEGVVLMQQVKGSREFVAGVSSYEELHMLMFGIGGIFIEAFNEVGFTILPLNANSCNKLLANKKVKNLLGAVRGMGAVDETKLRETLYRINQLVADFPNTSELDINPLMVDKSGNLFVVDARIALK